MTTGRQESLRVASAVSADGTPIGYSSLGEGPGLIIVGGVLSSGSDYLPLAHVLAQDFEVHVMDRRGRPGSGPQRQGHSIDDEIADLMAVAAGTGARAVFGHSFGGLVALETARQQPVFDPLFVYEPGVPLRGQFPFNWLDGYQRLLESGDRRGAFAWMVKHNGFAPRPLAVMPLSFVRMMLRLAIRPRQWASMDQLLEANLVEHRIEAAVDARSAERFSTITARTVLMGGTKSPALISQQLVAELAQAIPDAAVAILPGLDHLAPQHQPRQIAAAIVSNRNPIQQVPSGLARTTQSTRPTPSTDAPAQPAPPRER
jgi:pimeloyl-ACP methyl ester carboxylesterase